MKRRSHQRAFERRVSKKSPKQSEPSQALMAGALAGLLGVAPVALGCEDGPRAPAPEPTPTATETPTAVDQFYDIVVSNTPIEFDDFVTACEERGGFVQRTAACAGNNSCRGFSYIEPTLTEHSCKGLNQCGPGMSCVVLQADQGRTGQEIYEGADACASTCHAQFEPVYDPSVYTLYVRPATLTEEEALDRFENGSDDRLYSIVAFGVHGVNDDGIAYANMPPHYSKYSRAEIERVVAYIRTLTKQVQIYPVTGSPLGH